MPPESNQTPVPEPIPQTVSAPVAVQPAHQAPAEQAPVKIGKFKASTTIVKESWAVLKQDKEIMWFPIISSIVTLVAFIVMAILFYTLILGGSFDRFHVAEDKDINDVITYLVVLIYYLVMFCIINFFQAGLFIIVQGRFSGQNLSFKDGINGAMNNFGKIFMWSLVSATVGMILQIIADRVKIVGLLIARLLGAAWNIMTYFSLPALVIGGLGIKDSFKESAAIIRKTWGETIIINFGVSLFFMLIFFLVLALFIGIAVLVPKFLVVMSLAVLFVIIIVAMSIVSSTLSSIFKLALFNYARTGQVPQGFSEGVIRGAVKPGKAAKFI